MTRTFWGLYENERGLRDDFAAYWARVAAVFRDEVNVIGFGASLLPSVKLIACRAPERAAGQSSRLLESALGVRPPVALLLDRARCPAAALRGGARGDP